MTEVMAEMVAETRAIGHDQMQPIRRNRTSIHSTQEVTRMWHIHPEGAHGHIHLLKTQWHPPVKAEAVGEANSADPSQKIRNR